MMRRRTRVKAVAFFLVGVLTLYHYRSNEKVHVRRKVHEEKTHMIKMKAPLSKQQEVKLTGFDKFLRMHPVFRTYNIPTITRLSNNKSKKKVVNVLVIVSTAPKRRDRRLNIRKTWWKECVPTNEVC